MNSASHLHMLQTEIIPALQSVLTEEEFNNMIYQQDGSPIHITLLVKISHSHIHASYKNHCKFSNTGCLKLKLAMIFFESCCLVASCGLDSLSFMNHFFQRSNISWPRQPLMGKVLKFSMIFHDSTRIFFCFKTST